MPCTRSLILLRRAQAFSCTARGFCTIFRIYLVRCKTRLMRDAHACQVLYDISDKISETPHTPAGFILFWGQKSLTAQESRTSLESQTAQESQTSLESQQHGDTPHHPPLRTASTAPLAEHPSLIRRYDVISMHRLRADARVSPQIELCPSILVQWHTWLPPLVWALRRSCFG